MHMYPRPPVETQTMCSKRCMYALDRCPAAGWTAENCALQPPPLYCPGTCVYVNVYACMHIHASVCEHEYGYVCVYSCVCVCVCVYVCITHIHIYLLCCLISTLHSVTRFTMFYDASPLFTIRFALLSCTRGPSVGVLMRIFFLREAKALCRCTRT